MYFRFLFFFAICTCLFLGCLYLTKGSLPHKMTVIFIFCVATFFLPAFIMVIAYLGWVNKNYAREKAFSIPAFNELEKLGFQKALKHENNYRSFTEEIKEKVLNGYVLLLDVSTQRNHIIEVTIPVKNKNLKPPEIENLSRVFNQHDVVFKMGKVIKEYNSQKPYLKTIEELHEDLLTFTDLLRGNNFEARQRY